MTLAVTIIVFLIVLAALIFIHELGHFLLAKAFGIRVDAFKIGFGPKLLKWKRGETEYGLNLIPFGGYVKIFGEDPNEENTNGPDASRSFIHKPRWQQAIVLAAGVIFNFIFAGVLYVIMFASGVPAPVADFPQYSDRFDRERIMVAYVAKGSPAEKAGLKEGDVISRVSSSLGDITVADPALPDVKDTEQATDGTVVHIQDLINKAGDTPINLIYTRDRQSQSVQITPTSGLVKDKHAIGIMMDVVGDLRLPLFTSLKQGVIHTGNMLRLTTVGLYGFVASIFHGTADFDQVTGPVGIAGKVGDAVNLGFTYLLLITALISINLGVINLVPFPALDGGRIVFVIIESVIRRRIPATFANVVNTVGFALLMLLMVWVTYKDVVGLVK